MNLALRLACYAAVTLGSIVVLAVGVHWLVTPDPSLREAVHAKPAPIPPRIAASIERRMPVPRAEFSPLPIPAAAPAIAMQEAPASLSPARAVPEPPKTRVVKVVRGASGTNTQTYVVPAVTTARTDFPY